MSRSHMPILQSYPFGPLGRVKKRNMFSVRVSKKNEGGGAFYFVFQDGRHSC